jgi:beta-lactamase superfamily II metal-dependent hydrolase
METIKYLKSETAKVYKASDGEDVLIELLWGDRVEILDPIPQNGLLKVHSRWAPSGYIDPKYLGDKPLLELYFIDVGQGDGILIVTPERKHILIDGGYTRKMQPHGKSAADFVDWKFAVDYKQQKIVIDEMICSHSDADHYGGLWDLINAAENTELDCTSVEIKNFYHAGAGWWKKNGERSLGKIENGYIKSLLDDRDSIIQGLSGEEYILQGEWAEFMKCIKDTQAPCKRLSYNPKKNFDYLPGYGTDNPLAIKILGPIETIVQGKPALKDFKTPSQNTNGNSVLLRLDYGRSRILLTGDLNQKSQQYIVEALAGSTQELAADVVKSCHHGSDDCSYNFLQYVQAAATIISSGDDETHAHPRPNIVGASGATGFRKISGDKLLTPMIYSTEISRSLKIGNPYKVSYKDYQHQGSIFDISLLDEKKIQVSYKQTKSGGLNAEDKTTALSKLRVADKFVYGLVNVRTDGNKILCAVLNEGNSSWEIKTFESRF